MLGVQPLPPLLDTPLQLMRSWCLHQARTYPERQALPLLPIPLCRLDVLYDMAAGDVYLAGTVRNASEPCVLTGARSAEAPQATDLPFRLGACEAGSCPAGTESSQLGYIPAQPAVVLLQHPPGNTHLRS